MAKLYHYHADVGANGDLDCGLANGHDASCSKGILTNANEHSCKKVSKNFPQGKPHKCYHTVANDAVRAISKAESEVDIWLESRQAQPRPTRERSKVSLSPRSQQKKRK